MSKVVHIGGLTVGTVEDEEAKWIEQALKLIDDLRASVADGRVKAFAVVGIDEHKRAGEWRFKQDCVSDLEMLGAAQLLTNNIPVNSKPIG